MYKYPEPTTVEEAGTRSSYNRTGVLTSFSYSATPDLDKKEYQLQLGHTVEPCSKNTILRSRRYYSEV
jgi:hypothetical protein